ncbi:MAG: hypothetical protein OEV49_00855 [candidate division Zixibacteria bacterium]|nr:hypothetical protein [candidate division Zixibacteria bacterium]MDH3938386.1 hypothetical protein [candidate division Zixibacteria bacterium]MDH4035167.1 hypothetical protein [candidate division Zixibacteria bacterium]
MEISARIARQTALFTLLLLIAPMVIFPEQLGSSVLKASLIYAMYELVFYGLVIWMINHQASLMQLVQAAGVCFVYRLAVGAVFGLFIAVAYSMEVRVSMTLGTSGYLPALLLHVISTPFVLRPLWGQMLPQEKKQLIQPAQPEPPVERESGLTSIAVSKARGLSVAGVEPQTIAEPKTRPAGYDTFSQIPDAGGNGFERAVRYIGGDASVQMAAVLDHEGLLLGQFSRNQLECEDWAPHALTLLEVNSRVLSKGHWGKPEKLRIEMADNRLILAAWQSFTVIVMAQWQADDLLNIRINQGLEIIKKYVAERYGERQSDNAEKKHVPSA